MKRMKSEEFRSLGRDGLVAKIDELRRRQLELRLQIVTQHIANAATLKKALKASIACALTVQRQLQEEGGYER